MQRDSEGDNEKMVADPPVDSQSGAKLAVSSVESKGWKDRRIQMTRLRQTEAATLAVVLGICLALPVFLTSSQVSMVIIALMYAHLGLSWNIIGGYAGQLALGHALFFGAGAYAPVVAERHFDLSPMIGALLAIPIAALLAGIVGWLTFRFRLRGVYFAVATLVMAEVARVVAKESEFLGRTEGLFLGRESGLQSLAFASNTPLLYFWVVLVGLSAAWVWLMGRGQFGYSLLAIREHEDGAVALGIPVSRLKQQAFIYSAILTAAGGSLYIFTFRSVQPDQHLGLSISLATIIAAILGGRGTVVGPILGGLVVGALQSWLSLLSSRVGSLWFFSAAQALYGAALMVLILYAPRGIWGAVQDRFRKPR